MRAWPVQAITARADLEFVVVFCRSWRESIQDRFLGDGSQQRIAAQTSLKWGNRTEQIESSENLEQLGARLRCPHEVNITYLSTLFRTPDPGQERALIEGGK